MKRAGKAHWLIIAGIASVLVIAGLFLFGKDSAAQTADRFMVALAKGDVQTLTDLSFFTETPKDKLREKWDYTVHVASPHYLFVWKIVSVTHTDDQNAAARLSVVRNPETGGYEQFYQLPLVKEDGDWKVDVRAISRELYPGLPR